MKKTVAVMLMLLIGVFAFAGGWNNIFRGTEANDAGLNSYMRVPAWDENADDRVEIPVEMFGLVLSLDTLNVKVADATDKGESGTASISLNSGEVLIIDNLYVESGFDSGDYLELSNYDSNGAVLDTFNLVYSGFKTNQYLFTATQDTVLYFVFGDTTNVAKNVFLEMKILKR